MEKVCVVANTCHVYTQEPVVKQSTLGGTITKQSTLGGPVTKQSALGGPVVKQSTLGGPVVKQSILGGCRWILVLSLHRSC